MANAAKRTKEPKRVVLEKRFAGIAQGSILYVATPDIVAGYILKLPPGVRRSVEQMRRDLAKRNQADATCPVSTAIFIRSVAEVSLKQIGRGREHRQRRPLLARRRAGDADCQAARPGCRLAGRSIGGGAGLKQKRRKTEQLHSQLHVFPAAGCRQSSAKFTDISNFADGGALWPSKA